MKLLYISKIFLLGSLVMFSTTSCEDFLKEDNYHSESDQSYLTSDVAFEELVVGAYESLRSATKFYDFDFFGTDIFTRGNRIEGDDPLNDYTNLTSSNGASSSGWDRYKAISRCNMVITRANEIGGLDEDLKKLRLAEVKTLRAFHYFFLVQQFGGVPLVSSEVRTANTNFTRETEEETYEFIVSDLREAIADFPSNGGDYGRITLPAAQHLLAKVLLTRGYKSYAASTDFQEAAQLAEAVIANPNHELLDTFEEVFNFDNQNSNEVIFSVQYSDNPEFNGSGNNQYQMFKFGVDTYPGMDRTSDYGRGNSKFMPTMFFLNLFEENDARDEATLRRTWYAIEDDAENGITAGDIVIYMPKTDWTQVEKDAVNYSVYNDEDYLIGDQFTDLRFPSFKKFDDQLAPYGDNGGTRDRIIFRLAETYLIAAEAHLQNNNASGALSFVNDIRRRAAKDGFEIAMELNSVDIDVILDERARELAGEVGRWQDLKRTGKLQERALAHNPHVQFHHTTAFDSHYLLRPIPLDEILLSQGAMSQNPEYN